MARARPTSLPPPLLLGSRGHARGGGAGRRPCADLAARAVQGAAATGAPAWGWDELCRAAPFPKPLRRRSGGLPLAERSRTRAYSRPRAGQDRAAAPKLARLPPAHMPTCPPPPMRARHPKLRVRDPCDASAPPTSSGAPLVGAAHTPASTLARTARRPRAACLCAPRASAGAPARAPASAHAPRRPPEHVVPLSSTTRLRAPARLRARAPTARAPTSPSASAPRRALVRAGSLCAAHIHACRLSAPPISGAGDRRPLAISLADIGDNYRETPATKGRRDATRSRRLGMGGGRGA